jgi:putative transposase
MVSKKDQHQFSAKERREALEEIAEHGVPATVRKLRISKSTLYKWRAQQRAAVAADDAASEEDDGDDELPMVAEEKPHRHQRTAKVYTPSQRAQALEYAAKHGVTAASEKYKMSRITIYAWRRKVRLAAAGKGDCPTSGPNPNDIEAQRDREILDIWRKHPGLGPSQVKNQLRRQGVKISVNTVRRVMEEAGYRPPKVVRRKHDKRFESTRPNQMWHFDFVQRYINKQTTFTLILLDDHCRYVVGHGVDDAERADMVIDTFEQAVERYGKPESVMNDRGSAFWSWKGIGRLTRLLTELGVDQITARNKETNGKIEVFNGNIQKELFDRQRFYDVGEMRRRLGAHLHFYNHRRTHHALGGLLVPADRYYGRVEEILARIEAGGVGQDDPLLGRALELFKVISIDNRPEVWLMGQRLLPSKSKQ